MIRIVIALAVVLAAWYALARLRKQPPEKRQQWYKLLFAVLIGVLVLLAATGRLHWLYALVAAAIPLLRRGVMLLAYLPMLKQLRTYFSGEKNSQRPRPEPAVAGMDRDRAYRVLGLKPGATPEAIVEAHRRLMQKLHPDRGGSGYLAAEINRAKDLLLGETFRA